MFLACVELSDQGLASCRERPHVLQLKFAQLETAKVWAEEESSRRGDATGNVAVFEQMGPYMSLAWEREPVGYDAPCETPCFGMDELARQ